MIKVRFSVLLGAFDEEQNERYVSLRRAKFRKDTIRKVRLSLLYKAYVCIVLLIHTPSIDHKSDSFSIGTSERGGHCQRLYQSVCRHVDRACP